MINFQNIKFLSWICSALLFYIPNVAFDIFINTGECLYNTINSGIKIKHSKRDNKTISPDIISIYCNYKVKQI